ncbi:MAG TPA: hypothetical protein VK599_07725 [Streptosporangiaceae bacterium]|nr:hypothetical protein [Streptosporangiaceae bacterium]
MPEGTEAATWRTGYASGTQARAVYTLAGTSQRAGKLVGRMASHRLAETVSAEHNDLLALGWLLAAGLTTVIRNGEHEGAPGVLVCLDVEGPPLFTGRTLGDALAEARVWAEDHGHAAAGPATGEKEEGSG